MNLSELRAKKPEIIKIASQYGVREIKVFGSIARGDENENSDIDLLIDNFNGTFFGFASLKAELEDAIGKKIDLFKPNNIRHPLVRESIFRDLVPL
ncbi:MAG: nucleotidyltransferase family protein [Pseudomonadota bacterium]